jgi:hypothetical protein
VEVRLLDYSSGHKQVAGTVRLVNGQVVIEGDIPPAYLEEMQRGVVAGPGNRRVHMSEGAAFLRALPVAFSGSYFRAELRRP